jgi:hypothetical protein
MRRRSPPRSLHDLDILLLLLATDNFTTSTRKMVIRAGKNLVGSGQYAGGCHQAQDDC